MPVKTLRGAAPAAEAGEDGLGFEVVLIEREVFLQMGADTVEPVLLVGGELAAGGEAREGLVDALGGGEERALLVGGVLDHRDDVAHGFLFAEGVGALEIVEGEALGRGFEFFAKLLKTAGGPAAGALEENGDGFDVGLVRADPFPEGGEVVGGLVFAAIGSADEPFGGDLIFGLHGGEEGVLAALIADKQVLESRIAKQGEGFGEVVLDATGQIAGEFGDVAVGDEGGEVLPGSAGHFLVDALQALGEAAGVVDGVAVGPDVVDDGSDFSRGSGGRVFGDVGGVFEIGEETAVEAVEDDEVGLVGVALAFTGASAHHLREQDAGLDGTEKNDVFEIGDIDAGGEHVDGDDDAGGGAVAELADALEGARYVLIAGDFGDEGVAATEDFAGETDELVGVGSVLEIVDGEDKGFGEAAVGALVVEGVGFELFEDFSVGVGRGDFALDLGGVEEALVFEVVETGGSGIGVDEADFFAFLEEDAVNADVGFDLDNVVIDKEAFGDGSFVIVLEDLVTEERHGVAGRGGGEADFEGIEMIEGFAPNGGLGSGVTTVALVGDDEIEGVDREARELFGIFVVAFETSAPVGAAAEEVDGGALDSGDVDESGSGLGILQVVVG